MWRRDKKHHYKVLFRKALNNFIREEKIIGRSMSDKKPERESVFWLSMRRFISHAKSIIYLCNKKQNLEALMLLRPIIELTVNLKFILEDNTEVNLQQFLDSAKYEFDSNCIPKMGDYWSDKNLFNRMQIVGFTEDYYKTVIKKMHEEIHGSPTVIARAYYKNLTSMNSEAIFSIACQFAGHLLEVANTVYPKQRFMCPRDIWNKINFCGGSTA